MSAGSDPAAPSPRAIPLRVANKTAYVWDVDAFCTTAPSSDAPLLPLLQSINRAELYLSPARSPLRSSPPHIQHTKDIAVLRAQHRICGVLTGTLPHLAQQNVFLGVPLVLLPEEAALLVDIGAAVLVDDPSAHSAPPTDEALRVWQRERGRERERESKGRVGEGNGEKEKKESEAAVRKRREREEKRRRKAVEEEAKTGGGEAGGDDVFAPSSTTTTGEPSTSTSTSAIEPSSSAKPPSTTLNASNHPYTITIPAPSSALAWYAPAEHTYTTLDAARAAGVWDYPATLAERARCGVFKDLWRQGYFMGGGIKFGGEYLVYPGDPLRYHSHFAASVVESPIAKLRPMEIVAHGRLGTATKKAHLLCGWDDEKQEVSYLSIEWAGFG